MDEKALLDKLRTEGALPNEPDYHAWRAQHLTSYQLKVPRESEPWHLPDGRTIQVIAAPAGPLIRPTSECSIARRSPSRRSPVGYSLPSAAGRNVPYVTPRR